MNLNEILIKATDTFCELSAILGISPYLRPKDDLRLVFYHGIGYGVDPCLKYLSDEIPQHVFEQHLQYLKEKYVILPMRDALRAVSGPNYNITKPICSISFDDGLRSVFQKAYPILKRENIPATVFLNTAVIDNYRLNYQHLLSYMLSVFGVDEVSRAFNRLCDQAIPKAPNNEIAILDWYISNFETNYFNNLLEKTAKYFNLDEEKIASEERIYLHWEEIEEMQQEGFLFCSHTHNHFPLGLFANEEIVEREVVTSCHILRNKGKDTDFISFPFGMRYYYGNPAVEYAKQIGYKYIIEVGNGTNTLEQLLGNNILSRVCLGLISSKHSKLYSAIEMRPRVKTVIKKWFS